MKSKQKTQDRKKTRLLNIAETAAEYGGTEFIWRKQIWEGAIPVVQIGRKHYLDREDIEGLIAQRKVDKWEKFPR